MPGLNNAWKDSRRGTILVGGEDDHPAINVSWNEALAFAKWLGQKEGRVYRLPSDLEWSHAVGIGRDEDKDATPAVRTLKNTDEFPWGKRWPPPPRAGNFGDESTKRSFPEQNVLDGYEDGYPTTAPVMQFTPNKLGLYDLSGNAWEWCDDWWNEIQSERVIRGGHWNAGGVFGQNSMQAQLRSSARYKYAPTERQYIFGFRIVVELTAP